MSTFRGQCHTQQNIRTRIANWYNIRENSKKTVMILKFSVIVKNGQKKREFKIAIRLEADTLAGISPKAGGGFNKLLEAKRFEGIIFM